MKKVLSTILALVMCLTLCACGDNANNDGTSQTEGESLVVQNPDNGKPMINALRFYELLVKVELTTENWMDYIEVCSYTAKTIEKDAFGEIISTETNTYYELGAKGNNYYTFYDFVIELKNGTTGELITCGSNIDCSLDVAEDFSLDKYECTRIQGILYLVDIPDEAIAVYPDIGVRGFSVGFSDISYGPPYYCKLAGVDGRRIDEIPSYLWSPD